MRQEYDFSKGKRGPVIPPDPRKTRITIRIDTKILDWFRRTVNEAGGGNYQTMINEALKRYIESENEKTIRYPGGPHIELDDQYQRECEAKGLEFEVRFYDFEKNSRELRFDKKKAA
jgi:metal-responsive CopG/Arc/MetJ family transcriptional regulator